MLASCLICFSFCLLGGQSKVQVHHYVVSKPPMYVVFKLKIKSDRNQFIHIIGLQSPLLFQHSPLLQTWYVEGAILEEEARASGSVRECNPFGGIHRLTFIDGIINPNYAYA